MRGGRESGQEEAAVRRPPRWRGGSQLSFQLRLPEAPQIWGLCQELTEKVLEHGLRLGRRVFPQGLRGHFLPMSGEESHFLRGHF